MYKTLVVSSLLVLALLGYRFWLGGDSILKVREIKQALNKQEQELVKLKTRNQHLIANIDNLKKYPVAIEEQARYELGMVKANEKYYQVVEPIN